MNYDKTSFPSCPLCSKNDRVRKDGHRPFDGKQNYKCSRCKRRFVDPSQKCVFVPRTKVEKPQPRTEKPLPFLDCAGMLKKFNNPINAESLHGIPCFMCDNLESCDPNSCEKLDKWLNVGQNLAVLVVKT
jgi:hypothetical protein